MKNTFSIFAIISLIIILTACSNISTDNITDNSMYMNIERKLLDELIEHFENEGFKYDETSTNKPELKLFMSHKIGFSFMLEGKDRNNISDATAILTMIPGEKLLTEANVLYLDSILRGIINDELDISVAIKKIRPSLERFLIGAFEFDEFVVGDKTIKLAALGDYILAVRITKHNGNSSESGLENSNLITREEQVKLDTVSYVNSDYNFSIDIPVAWEGNYTVEKGKWMPEMEESINFKFTENNIVYDTIFSIIVIDEHISVDEWDHPFWGYIDTKDNKTFIYSQAGEPSLELLEERNKAKLEKLSIMIDQDLPNIISSFKFTK